MPLDGPNSVVYRSFFSCDDSKGVAKCKTSRKTKTGSNKSEDLMTNKMKLNYLKVSISYNQLSGKETVSDLRTQGFHNPSTIQLRDVSQESQKLNQLIDPSCCKGRIGFGMKSKDIAQDLLRGALDLQHSLEMFGKLQAKTKSKRKPKEKADRGKKLNASGNERSPDLFGYDGRRPEFNKPKFSAADGYSKDCYDELRDAIREGLAKQNLLPKSSIEDNAHFDRFQKKSEEKSYFDRTKKFSEEKGYLDRKNDFNVEKACFDRTKSSNGEKSFFYRTKSDLSMEFPSTSSDQSSMFHSREFDTSDSSFQWSFEEKDKGRNVIAKLMGLQEDPPKSSSYNPHKHLVNDKSLNYGRPIYDLDDLPKPRMPYFSAQNADSPRRSLEELTQTVQFKGLMTSPTTDRSERQRQLSCVFDRKKSHADDSPPIVIIKPLHVTGLLEEGHDKQKFLSLDLDTKEIIRKLKMKAVVPSRTKSVPKAALDINELQRKLQGEMSLLDILSHEKGDMYCLDASNGTGNRAVKLTENLSSSNMKASVPEETKMQTKEVINEKGHNTQKLATNTRKSAEGDIDKTNDAQTSRNINRVSSTSSRNHDIQPNVLRDQVSQLTATSTPTSPDTPLTSPQCSSTRKKKVKPEKLVSISVSTPLAETQLKNIAIQSNPCYEHDEQDLSVTKVTTIEEVPAVASKNLDYWNKTESHLIDFTSVIKPKIDPKSTNKRNDMKVCNTTKNLLLGNPLFLNKVEELFYTNAYQPSTSRTSSSRDDRISADDKLLLDCAKELLENKSLQSTGTAQRFSHALTNKTKNFVFLDQVVTEVCDGMEDLSSYRRRNGEKFAQDTLPKVLHKDLWCKGVVNGGWDMGWRCGFTSDEVEQIVVSIEQHILNGFIENTIADIMC